MRRVSLIGLVLLVAGAILFLTKFHILAAIPYGLFAILYYMDTACTRKLPFCKPIRRFLFRYDTKHFLLRKAKKHKPLTRFDEMFILAIGQAEPYFIHLGFQLGMQYVCDAIILTIKSAVEETMRVKIYVPLTEKEKKQQEKEENVRLLNMFVPDWEDKLFYKNLKE